MIRRWPAALVLFSAGVLLPVVTQAQVAESLVRWPYYKEVLAPAAGAGLADFLLDVETLDRCRDDYGDLRLYDAAGNEIPYALRILRDEHTSDAFEAREFNRGVSGAATQASFDLGAQPEEHNEIEVDTGGQNFRRRVLIEGSYDGFDWSTLGAAFVFRFASSGGGGVDERTVKYPVSRYRYLRVRVYPDPQADEDPPKLLGVTIRRTLHVEGERQEFPSALPVREATRENGRPASAYRFDFAGRIPIEALVLTIAEDSFSRPYRLATVDDPASPVFIASGQLSRSEGGSGREVKISFQERSARRLLLTVTDDRNAPLSLTGGRAQSAARQVVFEAGRAAAGPVKLYYGNRKAGAPHYDFASSLPRILAQPPQRLFLGAQRPNPSFEPEPKPLTERSPWLIYLVLGLASAALFAILVNLTRTMGKTADS